MRILTLYTRAGCHLCEAMAHGLARLRARRAFDLVTVDIDTDPELVERFGDKIPVLADGDREICRYVLDESRVEALLREV